MIIPDISNNIDEVLENKCLTHELALLRGDDGCVMVSAHMGSWEMVGAIMGNAGVHLYPVVKRQANPYVDRYINRRRAMYGSTVVYAGMSVKKILKVVKKGGVPGLISDQDSGRHGVFVDFFNRPASTPVGAAALALKYNIPIVIIIAVRTVPGKYHVYSREVKQVPGDTVETLTARYTGIIEDVVRKHPEQYFWMHKRWKTRPPVESADRADRTGEAVHS